MSNEWPLVNAIERAGDLAEVRQWNGNVQLSTAIVFGRPDHDHSLPCTGRAADPSR